MLLTSQYLGYRNILSSLIRLFPFLIQLPFFLLIYCFYSNVENKVFLISPVLIAGASLLVFNSVNTSPWNITEISFKNINRGCLFLSIFCGVSSFFDAWENTEAGVFSLTFNKKEGNLFTLTVVGILFAIFLTFSFLETNYYLHLKICNNYYLYTSLLQIGFLIASIGSFFFAGNMLLPLIFLNYIFFHFFSATKKIHLINEETKETHTASLKLSVELNGYFFELLSSCIFISMFVAFQRQTNEIHWLKLIPMFVFVIIIRPTTYSLAFCIFMLILDKFSVTFLFFMLLELYQGSYRSLGNNYVYYIIALKHFFVLLLLIHEYISLTLYLSIMLAVLIFIIYCCKFSYLLTLFIFVLAFQAIIFNYEVMVILPIIFIIILITPFLVRSIFFSRSIELCLNLTGIGTLALGVILNTDFFIFVSEVLYGFLVLLKFGNRLLRIKSTILKTNTDIFRGLVFNHESNLTFNLFNLNYSLQIFGFLFFLILMVSFLGNLCLQKDCFKNEFYRVCLFFTLALGHLVVFTLIIIQLKSNNEEPNNSRN